MKSQYHIAFGKRQGILLLPDVGAKLRLNPVECTLYRLFLSHPEGIAAADLVSYWQELCAIYENESRYDDKNLRDDAMESLCDESKIVFYSNVSRIKRKFVDLLGRRRAASYIIRRDKDGLYKTRACPSFEW